MTDARDVVHQIEYRWDPVKDMSPVASSMPPDVTQGWDLRIRPWVRHPNVDAPSESVCYQVLPAETVALAWRYRDRQAAEREGGTHGRPLVSRVLVGPASLLPPHLAMMLCRVGLPALTGPRAGQGGGADLAPIGADTLTRLAADRAAWLDQSAAQEKGLQQVVAAALSDPHTPLAIQLRDPYIFHEPRVAPQSLLLWGLWRTVGPLLGRSTARRGWSFSTFELPMGDQDASALPDIVFRLAQAASGPPVNARQEIRVRPGDPTAPATLSPDVAELAEWLVSEYRETDGEQLAQLIAGCGTGQPLETRLRIVFDVLRDKWSPVSMSSPAASFVSVLPGQEPVPGPVGTDESADAEHRDPPGYQEVDEYQDVPPRRETRDYWDVDEPQDTFGYPQDTSDYPEVAQFPNAVGYWEPAGHENAPEHVGRAPVPDTSGEPEPRHPAAAAQVPPPGEPEPRHPAAAAQVPPPGEPEPRHPAAAAQVPPPGEPEPRHPAAAAQVPPPGEPEPRHPAAAAQVPPPGEPEPRHPAAAAQVPPPGEPWPEAFTPPDRPSRSAKFRPPSAPAYEQQESLRPRDDQPYPVASLLSRLETEPDSRVFQSILHDVLAYTTRFDERVVVRRQMPRCGWYIPAFERHGYKDCVPDLAGIFQVLVLPDLERPSVASVLGGWVRKGPPEVTAALLTASKAADEGRRSGGETFRLMTDALGEAGLQKLLEVSGIPFDWPRQRRDTRPGRHHSDGGFFAKIFGLLGLRGDNLSADLPVVRAGVPMLVASAHSDSRRNAPTSTPASPPGSPASHCHDPTSSCTANSSTRCQTASSE